MTKDFKLLCETLARLIKNKDVKIDKVYIDDVVKAMELFANLYVMPDFEKVGRVPDINISLAHNYGLRGDEGFQFAEYNWETGVINVRVGLLYDLYDMAKEKYEQTYQLQLKPDDKEFKKFLHYYFRQRNRLVIDVLSAVAHECRHLMQFIYLDAKRAGQDDHVSGKLLGEDVESIIQNLDGDEYVEYPIISIARFLLEEGVIHCKDDMNLLQQPEQDLKHIFYFKQPYEKDARAYSRKKIHQLKLDIVKSVQNADIDVGLFDFLFGDVKSKRQCVLADMSIVRKKVSKFYQRACSHEEYMAEQEEFIDWWISFVQENIAPDEFAMYFIMNSLDDGEYFELFDVLKNNLFPQLFAKKQNVEIIKQMFTDAGLTDHAQMIEAWQEDNLYELECNCEEDEYAEIESK